MSNRISNSEGSWRYCTKCLLSETRRNVVLRGWGRVRRRCVDRDGWSIYYAGVPSEERTRGLIHREEGPFLLFIGEAPDQHDDIRGLPFQGAAGRILSLALSHCTSSFHFELTHLVACRPIRYSTRLKHDINRPPSPQEKQECLPRIVTLTQEIEYNGIVYLGKEAQMFKIRKKPSLLLQHPEAILKKEYKLYDIKNFAYKLDEYVNAHFETRK